jgi:hypothetical protein
MKAFIKYRGIDLVCTISNHSIQWGADEIDEDDFSIGAVTVEDSEIDIQELLDMDEIRDLIIKYLY